MTLASSRSASSQSAVAGSLKITACVMGAAPLLRPILEGSVADPDAMPDRLVARYLAPFVGRDGVNQLLTLARSVRAQDLHEEELRSIGAPTMIVVGEAFETVSG